MVQITKENLIVVMGNKDKQFINNLLFEKILWYKDK